MNSILKQIISKNNKQGFVRNLSILTVCNILVCFFNLFINICLARELQPEGYGKYGVIVSLSSILMTLSSFGIQQVAIRRIAQAQDKSWYQYKISITSRLLGYGFVIIPYFFYGLVWSDFTFDLLVLLVLNVIMLTLWDGIQNVAFGMQRMEYTGYINIFGTASLFFFYLLIPRALLSVSVAVAVLVSIALVKNIVYYHRCKKEGLFTFENNHAITKSAICDLIKESFPFYMLAVLSLFSTQWPVIFLSQHSGMVEVAYFNTANKIMVPASLMLSTLMAALLPNLSKEYVKNPGRFIQKVNLIFKLLAAGGILGSIGLSFFRDELVLLFFGKDYSTTGNVLLAQSWYLVFHAFFSLFGNVLTAAKQENVIVKLALMYAIINTLIFWFASYHGATIMSYGVILGCIINLIYHYIVFANKIAGFIDKTEMLVIFLIIILTMTLSFILVPSLSFLLRIVIVLGLLFIVGCNFNRLSFYIKQA